MYPPPYPVIHKPTKLGTSLSTNNACAQWCDWYAYIKYHPADQIPDQLTNSSQRTLPQVGGCCFNLTIFGSIELFYLSQSVQWLQSVPILWTLMQIERCELNFVTAILTRGGFSIIFMLHPNVNGTFQRIIRYVLHSASVEIDLILKKIQLVFHTRNRTYSVIYFDWRHLFRSICDMVNLENIRYGCCLAFSWYRMLLVYNSLYISSLWYFNTERNYTRKRTY